MEMISVVYQSSNTEYSKTLDIFINDHYDFNIIKLYIHLLILNVNLSGYPKMEYYS